MAKTSTQVPTSSRTSRSAVSNGTRLVQGVDGRSANARRFRDLVRLYIDELGGPSIMTEAMTAVVKQAAVVTLEAERIQGAVVRGEAVDADNLVRLSNVLQRLMTGLRAKAKTAKAGQRTDLSEYVRRKVAA